MQDPFLKTVPHSMDSHLLGLSAACDTGDGSVLEFVCFSKQHKKVSTELWTLAGQSRWANS